MTVIGVRSPHDAMLGTVAPLALAAAATTALVIDGDPAAACHATPAYATPGSLARLVADGPRRTDLVPALRGVAVLGNGGVSLEDAGELIDAFAAAWPHVVVRMPPDGESQRFTTVSVVPLLPQPEAPSASRADGTTGGGSGEPVVYQRGAWSSGLPPRSPDAVVVPRPAAITVRRLLCGRAPGPSRWIRAWRTVWTEPWR